MTVKKKLLILAAIIILGLIGWKIYNSKKTTTPQYQTAKVEKGTLSVVVTASGQVSQANSATVNTEASGVIKEVLAQNGQMVKSGDKIATIDLDLVGQQRAAQALSSYQLAKNNLESAKATQYSLQSDMLTKWDKYKELAESDTYKDVNSDNRKLPEFYVPFDDWLAAEAKYKNQAAVISQTQTALSAAWLSYQQTASTIYAPIAGTVTGLALQTGSVLTAQSNSSGTSTAQKIASIQTGASPIIQVNLTQIDTPKVKIGDIATVTFDAFSSKTFTGKVISLDTIGAVSSGVTTYPAMIKLDVEAPEIFSNMTAQANIITQIKDEVLIVPTSAVQTKGEKTTVKVMKNNQPKTINVETGLTSTTQTEIVAGLSEGDTVVTGTITSPVSKTQTRSIFSGGGGGFRGN